MADGAGKERSGPGGSGPGGSGPGGSGTGIGPGGSGPGRSGPGIGPGAPWLRAHAVPVPFRPDPRCVTCTPPDADPDVVAFTDHWKIVLHPDQTAPGACLLGSRRHVARVGELTTDEAADLFRLYATLEPVLERVIGADLVNLSCLRNWAYREVDPEPPWADGRPNPHVHWHVAPRYREPITVAGEPFVDVDFGEELVWTGRRLPPPVRTHLIATLRDALPITFVPPDA